MTDQLLEVIIDSREESRVIYDLATHFILHADTIGDWSEEELPAGDIEIGGIGFERKTISDFASSLMEDRLFEQAYKLNQRYEHAYILIEGNLSQTDNRLDIGSDIAPASLRGAMASLTSRHGLPVICCSNRRLLADMAVRLARKHIEEASSEVFPTSDIKERDMPTAMRMYGCIPGVGPETARTLHGEYPTIAEFMRDASIDSLKELDGIGDKMASEIMGAFL